MTPEDASQAVLLAAVAVGRAAWPRLALDERLLLQHLAERPGAELAAPERVADLYLACACAHRVPGAVEAFELRHLRGAPGYLRSFGDPAFVADILQDIRERLLVGTADRPPRILEYAGRGSLEAFVRVMATRLALDRQERARWERPVAQEPEELVDAADPETDAIRAEHRQDFDRTLRDVLGTLTPEERTLLRLYVVDHLNIAEIGAIVGASRATVARRIAACRERVLADTRSLLHERLGLGRGDLDSILRLFRSSLDVSLHGFLVSRP